MSFGQKLRQVREAKGLTQEGLARAANLSTSAVSKMEQEQSDPKLSTLTAICRALDVPCTEFVPTGK